MNTKFPGTHKLKQKRHITALFEKGKWKSCGSLRIITLISSETGLPQIGVSVSKRNFKKAVDRNRIKRLLREAYRLKKEDFHKAFGENIHAMIFWNSRQMPKNYDEVREELMQFCRKVKPS